MMIKKNIFISLKNSIWFRKNKTELEHFWENTWPKGKTNTRFFFSLWKSISKRTKKRFTNTKKEIKKSTIFFKNCIIKWEKHNSTQFRILPIAKNKKKWRNVFHYPIMHFHYFCMIDIIFDPSLSMCNIMSLLLTYQINMYSFQILTRKIIKKDKNDTKFDTKTWKKILYSNSNSFSMCHKIHAFLCGLKYSILIVEI